MDEQGYRFIYKHFRPSVDPDAPLNDRGEPVNGFIEVRDCASRWPDFVAWHYTKGKTEWEPKARGGLTRCYVYEDDDVVAIGDAKCSPLDAFCYSLGREIAKGRALKVLESNDD